MKKIFYLFISLIIFLGIDYVLSKTKIPVNEKHYLLGFKNFQSMAEDTKGQKRIILVGGSSLAWGVSAEALTGKLGIITLNSGIHAGVGFMHFMEIIKDVVDKENDILLFSPEYGLVSNDSFFSRSKEYCYISLYVKNNYPLKCIGYSLNLLSRVFPVIDMEQNEYNNDGFNNFGDFVFRIAGKNMVGKMNNEDICSKINISELTYSYIPYMNRLKNTGYRIIYIPNFIPKVTCQNLNIIRNFHNQLFNEFGIKGHKNQALLFDEKYFYNSANHLTKEGIRLKTKIFEKQLLTYLNNI